MSTRLAMWLPVSRIRAHRAHVTRDDKGRAIWTDADGLRWEVIDCWRPEIHGTRKRLALGSWKAETRAFVPVEREGPVMLYQFDRMPYRDATDKILAGQLQFAKPAKR